MTSYWSYLPPHHLDWSQHHKHSWSISSSYKFLILTGAGIKMSSDKRLWFKKKEKILITTYVYSKHVWGTCGTQCRCKSTKLHVQLYGKACISHLSVHDKAENSLFPVEFTKIPGNGKTVFWAFLCYCPAFSPNLQKSQLEFSFCVFHHCQRLFSLLQPQVDCWLALRLTTAINFSRFGGGWGTRRFDVCNWGGGWGKWTRGTEEAWQRDSLKILHIQPFS